MSISALAPIAQTARLLTPSFQGRRPSAVHASVFDRLEWLFALDQTMDGCNDNDAPDKAVICAQEIAANSLIPEQFK
jgi:hypothetical protein